MPVVLIHGALRWKLGLIPTARFLKKRGFDARIFGYATRRHTLDEHGEMLEAFIHDWLGERPAPVLGFVTHSMGGLVARSYLARAKARAHSRSQRLVMLAPPNQGSKLAQINQELRPFHWLYGKAASELLPDNVQSMPLPPSTAQVIVFAGGRLDGREGYHPSLDGNDDGVVAVRETQLGDVEPELVGGVHSFLQWRTDVLERAARFLVDGEA
jgi:pimeloyl-ACP methyl ester carboxylesterase